MSKGPPLKYPVRHLEIGDTVSFEAPTGDDVKRIHKSVHQAAERNGILVRGKIDRKTRIITFKRTA